LFHREKEIDLRVTKVTREHYWLENGEQIKHYFTLSEPWSIEQMQTVYDLCCLGAPKPLVFQPKPRPDLSKEKIVEALEACNYKQVRAAERIGVPLAVLRGRIKKYGITHPRWYKLRVEF
jgi:DNA-binding NtrC family response regulator